MSQRMRMLDAMAQAAAEKGYVRTTVADVIKRAGVSRETFYQQFAGKEDCFLAAYETGAQLMLGAVAGALGEPAGDPLERVGRGLRAYLETLAREPAIARTALIEVYGAGERALALRVEQQARFADAVAGALGARTDAGRFACEAFVAAVSALVTNRVAQGRTEELPQLHGPLMDLLRRWWGEARAVA